VANPFWFSGFGGIRVRRFKRLKSLKYYRWFQLGIGQMSVAPESLFAIGHRVIRLPF
jgi:hypothetical protein